MKAKKLQALSSRIPPVWAATVASDLYKPHACLQDELYINWKPFGNELFVSRVICISLIHKTQEE